MPSRRSGDHVTLVLSCCFSAWRSSGELDQAIEQGGVGQPLAAHSFEYMLMVVKPGMVLISLT